MNESGCRSRYSRRMRTLLNLNEDPDRGKIITGDDEQHVPPGWRDVGRSWGARHELPAAASGDGEADVACAGVASLCVKGFRPGPPVVMLCRCSARSSLVDHCWLPLDVDRACAPAGWLVMDEPASCEVWDRAAC